MWTGTGSCLLVSMQEKQLLLFNQPNNTGAIDVKTDRSALEDNSSFKMLGLSFFLKFGWGSFTISIAKTVSEKIGALIHSI